MHASFAFDMYILPSFWAFLVYEEFMRFKWVEFM